MTTLAACCNPVCFWQHLRPYSLSLLHSLAAMGYADAAHAPPVQCVVSPTLQISALTKFTAMRMQRGCLMHLQPAPGHVSCTRNACSMQNAQCMHTQSTPSLHCQMEQCPLLAQEVYVWVSDRSSTVLLSCQQLQCFGMHLLPKILRRFVCTQQ